MEKRAGEARAHWLAGGLGSHSSIVHCSIAYIRTPNTIDS